MMVLTILAMVLGYLTLSISAALLYAIGIASASTSGETLALTSQFMAFAGICGLGFATLSGYIVALVARRSPVAHTAAFSLTLAIVWAAYAVLSESREPSLISILNIAIALIGVMAGGQLRSAQMRAAQRVEMKTEIKN